MNRIFFRLLKEVAWAPVGVLIAHAILGARLGHEPYVDPVMHFLGGAAIAYFLRRAAALSPQLVGAPSNIGLSILAFGMACFAALVWEFGEWSSDIILGTHIQIHAANTLRDLSLGVGGACVYLCVRSFGCLTFYSHPCDN